MKKRLVTALALMFGLGVGATAFAAANPFVDVPAKHWAYDAVNKLAKAGIVDGYGDGTFRGDRTMTRYEMAQIVAKAMARSDKADAETKATIDKLATEFSAEIENLGVRVAKLEKKSDNVRFDGNLRVRYNNQNVDNNGGSSDRLIRMRLAAHAAVNEDWNVHAMFETNINDVNTANNNANNGSDDSRVYLDTAYAEGPLGSTTLSVGKFIQTETGDFFLDESFIKGARLGFGNQLKAQVYYGTISTDGYFGNDATNSNSLTAYGTSLNWAANKNLNVFGSYTHFKNRNNELVFGGNKDNINAWDIGAAYKLSQDWKVTAAYGATSADTQNKALRAEFQYKAIDLNKAGTWQAALGYWKQEDNASYDTGFLTADVGLGGVKGWYFDGAYVPAKNIKLRALYGDLKSTVGTEVKDKYTRIQAEFFF